MRFWAPAKCTSAGAQTDTLSQNKRVYRGSQNALRHLARENALADNAPMRLWSLLYIGSVGCREMPWSAQP